MSRSDFMGRVAVARRTRRLAVPSSKIARGLREAFLSLALVLLAAALGGDAASAQSALTSDPRDAADLRSADDRWRARGVAFIDLPFGLRARYETQSLHRLDPRHDLSAPFAEYPAGAAPRGARLIEGRFALSRTVAPHLELELAWTACSPRSIVDLLRVEDQRVAAMIRFVP